MSVPIVRWPIAAPLAGLALALLTSGAALACACCADPGHRSRSDWPIADLGFLLDDIALDPRANLFLTACGDDCVIGVTDPKETYDITVDMGPDRWTFSFSTPGARTPAVGTLSMPTPGSASVSAVDPKPTPETGMVVLYKEIQFEGPLSGTGIFAPSHASGARLQLILQGLGNACPDASGFENWSLVARGGGVDFLFFGSINTP